MIVAFRFEQKPRGAPTLVLPQTIISTSVRAN
jgi:hypothetical protein